MIETKRLILRELNPTDASDFYKLNLNQNVIQYTGDSSFKNIDEARDFLQNYSDYKKMDTVDGLLLRKKINNLLVGVD